MRNSFLGNLGFKLLLVFCLLTSLAAGLWLPGFMTISEVNVQPNSPTLFWRDVRGESLLLLNTKSFAQELLANNPTLSAVEVSKHYPRTLIINYKKAIPIAQIENQSHYFLLSKEGKIIAKQSMPHKTLPILKSFQKLRYYESRPGQYISNPDLRYALSASQLAPDYGIDYEYLEVSKPSQLKIVGEKTVSYLNTKKQIAKNLKIVQNITVTLKRKGQVPKVINLFFEKAAYTL